MFRFRYNDKNGTLTDIASHSTNFQTFPNICGEKSVQVEYSKFLEQVGSLLKGFSL